MESTLQHGLQLDVTVNPQTHQLYHQYQQVWHTYQPECWQPMEIIYPMQPCILQEAPTNTVPATPHLLHSRIHLSLPIHMTLIHPSYQLHHIKQCCKNWLHHLTPGKDHYGPIYNQWQILDSWNLAQHKMIMLVSDALVSPNGKGSCAWTIWSQAHLWQGSGHMPGPNLDMYLGLAEAYGMYMVLSFLQQYLATFPLVLPTNMEYKYIATIKDWLTNSTAMQCTNTHVTL